MLPMSVTVPPLRVQSMAAATVSLRPTASEHDIDADAAGQLQDVVETRFVPECNVSSAPSLPRQFQPRCVDIRDQTRACIRRRARPASVSSPIMPAPITSAVSPPFSFRYAHGVQRHGDGFEHGGLGKRDVVRQPVDDALRNGDELGKGAMAAVVAAGNADHLAVVAEVDFAAPAEGALPAVDGGVERDAVAGFAYRRTSAPMAATVPAASWPITIGGMRRPDEPSYPCTSLPQMPQASTRTSTSSGPIKGAGRSAISRWLYSERRRDFIINPI